METLVVNLYAGPGAGKSTGAAYIFSKLKMLGITSELVTEYAKDKVWQGDKTTLQCQIYMSGKQAFRMMRVYGKVEVIVTDSPLPMGAIYTDEKPIQDVCIYEGAKYKNQLNFFIERGKDYDPKGRNQTLDEAKVIDERIKKLLVDNNIEYTKVCGALCGYDWIVDKVSKIVKPSLRINV